MKKAIIFDLDGTLWDSSKQVVEAWNVILARYPELNRQITQDDMQSYMGKTMDDIAEIMLPDIEPERSHLIVHECGNYENKYLESNPGIIYPLLEDTLKRLYDKYLLYIVSNCQEGYIEAFMNGCNLKEYFSDIECYGKTNLKKCDNIKLIIQRNNIDKALYVGDTQLDYESAIYAGIPFIHSAYGFGKIKSQVPYINSISELPELALQIISC